MRSVPTALTVTGLILGITGSAFSQGGGFGSAGGIGSGGASTTVTSAMTAIGAPQSCLGYSSGMHGDGEKLVYSFRFGSCFAAGVVRMRLILATAALNLSARCRMALTLPSRRHRSQ